MFLILKLIHQKVFNVNIGVLLVLYVHTNFLTLQDSGKSDEPPVNDVLDFLVKFSKKMDQEGQWPPEEEQAVSSTASSSKPSSATVEIPGCKAKAGPPMQIPLQPTSKASPPTMAAPVATPSDGFAKGLPMPVDEKYEKKQLVVNPYEMKKFLYGTSQKLPDED